MSPAKRRKRSTFRNRGKAPFDGAMRTRSLFGEPLIHVSLGYGFHGWMSRGAYEYYFPEVCA